MINSYRNILIIVSVLIMSVFYKPMFLFLLPNSGALELKLLEEGLQLLTVIVCIFCMKLWSNVGVMTNINKESLILLLPIFALSFIPLINGLDTNGAGKMTAVMLAAIFIGFSEELACRGAILYSLQQKGKILSVIISAALFGLLHIINLFKGADIVDTLIQIVFAFGFGLTMAIVRARTGLLLPQIIVHSLWDFNNKIAKDNTEIEWYETAFFISMALIITWGIFLTIKEQKNDKQNVAASGSIACSPPLTDYTH